MMFLESASCYLASGLSVLPAILKEKRPAVGRWKRYQENLPTEQEVQAWFSNGVDATCLITGAVSGNLELIDFDCQGESFAPWRKRVEAASPGLLEKLFIEASPSGGRHVVYRCEQEVCGSIKLAQRMDPIEPGELTPDGNVIRFGKKYQARQDEDGNWRVLLTLIETRGEGGLFLCTPTPGYEPVQGNLSNLSVLSGAERDALLQAAWDLNEYVPPLVNGPANKSHSSESPSHSGHGGADISHNGAGAAEISRRPGDDFNRRGEVRDILTQCGWSCVKGGENEYWRRPGKTSGWSASLRDGVLYVFSSSAAPFEPNRAYSPFSVYALLLCGGDFEQAARSLRQSGYGGDSLPQAAPDVNISGLLGLSGARAAENSDNGDSRPHLEDPGPMPDDLLRIPGFVSEVMDHCLETAPYPNPVMAFCGGLSLQAFLAGRKVRDPGDNRTNLYLLGLAHSAAGKDWPRKINTRILHALGLADALGDRFASGEGIQDALFITPSMLFQTDEIDGMLQQISKAQDARHENIMGTLLTLYSSSNSVFPMRRKAGKESAGAIDQPCLTVFGTAIPNHYYQALSERMLTNGFFARMIILESGPRCTGQEPSIKDVPARVMATAKWWADFRPGSGNLQSWHPVPAVVGHAEEAKPILVATREEAEAEYAKAEAVNDSVGTTVWGRVSEQVRKLALLHAVSACHTKPVIDEVAAIWATRFVLHQTRRMLFMAQAHVAETQFQAECLKLLRKLGESPEGHLPHSVLLKRMKIDAKAFAELVSTLEQRGDIVIEVQNQAGNAGRPTRRYRLVGGGEKMG